MVSFEELKTSYRWTAEDEENLRSLSHLVPSWVEEFLESIRKDEHDERCFQSIREWLIATFSGPHDERYVRKIHNMLQEHLKAGCTLHHLQVLLSSVREFLLDKLTAQLGYSHQRDSLFRSVEKTLDLSLSIMLLSQKEEVPRHRRLLLDNIQRGLWILDLFIVISLFIVGVFLISWISYEFLLVLLGRLPLEKGGLSILGSILILYAISELLAHEVKHVKSGIISLKVFVGVALAALIRKVLIVSLTPEKMYELLSLAGVIVSLGLVYWLIHRVEEKV
ncbi:conserved hypothetical protein [Thermocrinis albus DSM 14484]|uniref:Globin-sensor domain-containing protein n=1 Tax=Thermocrinis albus (strain DSM 14484 / JCM 11386 / HI 11/12) TaxID=638303 RepID=D3SMS5_THEAH|nr:phosphate-starvation-inducible PsiE family protein [Thermocrinis albus]ADC90055.1 conserved hypothetical protein [Thermocrinis albus DSM 14484]